MSAGIEAALHLADEVVDDNYETGDWGFTQVDARNAFNELNRYRMLCTVEHLWLVAVGFIVLLLELTYYQRTS